MSVEFKDFGKIPRLFRRVVITEKIDGTNAAVGIMAVPEGEHWPYENVPFSKMVFAEVDTPFGNEPIVDYAVYAQSRNRIITPEQDNHGLARWVWDNAKDLVTLLGEGLHFGEWWGSGIQRGYGLPKGEKRFSLFNTKRWAGPDGINANPDRLDNLLHVPVLYDGLFSQDALDDCLGRLAVYGSAASPGFMRPEGIIIYHTAGGYYTKVTLNGDGNKGMDGR